MEELELEGITTSYHIIKKMYNNFKDSAFLMLENSCWLHFRCSECSQGVIGWSALLKYNYLFYYRMGEKYDGVRVCWNPKSSVMYPKYRGEFESIELHSTYFNEVDIPEQEMWNYWRSLSQFCRICSWMVNYGLGVAFLWTLKR